MVPFLEKVRKKIRPNFSGVLENFRKKSNFFIGLKLSADLKRITVQFSQKFDRTMHIICSQRVLSNCQSTPSCTHAHCSIRLSHSQPYQALLEDPIWISGSEMAQSDTQMTLIDGNMRHSDGPTMLSKSHMKLSDGPMRVSEFLPTLVGFKLALHAV